MNGSGLVNRFLCILVGLVVATLVLVAPAAAAPPANDTFAGAVTISALPFSDTVDTTEATTDADDANANASCGAPATDASVWYAFTPASATGVSVDVSASDYSAGVIVVTGSPGSFALVACGPGSVGFSASAGVTYYLLAFDDTPDGTNGGTLQISVTEAALPEAAVTVDPTGLVNPHTGVITVSGTFTCANADFAFVDVTVTQRVGRFTITGFGEVSADPCDGQSHPWSLGVTGSNGRFAGGKANVDAFMFACGPVECATDEAIQTVRLRPR
jgi:Family of unknown function (DUF6299)